MKSITNKTANEAANDVAIDVINDSATDIANHPPNALSRRERERLSRRTAILDAAKAVFAERGYAEATLEEIASRAEFGKGTLYNYFPEGKEQMLLAIFDQLYDGLCELIESSFSDRGSEPFRTTVKTFISNCFQFFHERFNLFMILVKESEHLIFSDNEDRVAYFTKQQERVLKTLSAPLKSAMDRGELREMPPELLAHMLFVNIKGCQMRHCPRHSTAYKRPIEKPADELATFLTELVLYGAAAPEHVESRV